MEACSLADSARERAGEEGFNGVIDVLKVGKNGKGEYVYLVRLHDLPPGRGRPDRSKATRTRSGE